MFTVAACGISTDDRDLATGLDWRATVASVADRPSVRVTSRATYLILRVPSADTAESVSIYDVT